MVGRPRSEYGMEPTRFDQLRAGAVAQPVHCALNPKFARESWAKLGGREEDLWILDVGETRRL